MNDLAAATGPFLLAAFDEGALLLDLESGNFFQLNPAARCIAEGLLHHETANQLGARLLQTFGVSAKQAAADVQAFLAQLKHVPAARGNNSLSFVADRAGFLLHWDGVPACHIDQTGSEVTGAAAADGLPDTAQQLLWAVPHLLMLRGNFVLHAAAVQVRSKVLAFCGPSGSGKTTLARLAAEQGSVLLAEDLLVVECTDSVPVVYTGAESAIRTWVLDHAPRLATAGRLRTDDLAQVFCGPRVPLQELLFLQRGTQTPPAIVAQPTSKVDSLALLLENSFAELGTPAVWRRVWAASLDVVEGTRIQRLRVPEGLDLLREMMAAYSRTVKW